MKKPLFLLPILLAILFLSSCKDFSQIVEIDIPEHESKLAVTTVIGDTDRELRVLVSNSIGIRDERSDFSVSNAQVQLFRDGQLFESLPYQPDNQYYEIVLQDSVLSHGSTFHLEASTPDYPRVSAVQIMPHPVSISKVEIELGGTVDFEGYRVDELIVEFQDPPGEKNYYGLALEGQEMIIVNGDTIWGGITQYLESTDPSFTPVYNTPYTIIFSDAGFNGKKARINCYTYSNLRAFKGEVLLYHLTEDLYQYNRSVVLYENAIDNPFAEPVTVHNNIENGYGLFGLHARSTYTIE